MNKKAVLLEQWLKVNNVALKNEITYCKDENKYRDIQVGLDVMISVLLGENLTKGSNFYAVENLVGTDNPTVDFIRNASFEELYGELTKLSDEKGIKSNLSLLNHNKIIDLYEEKKALGEITTSGYNEMNTKESSNQSPSYDSSNQKNDLAAQSYTSSNSVNSGLYKNMERDNDPISDKYNPIARTNKQGMFHKQVEYSGSPISPEYEPKTKSSYYSNYNNETMIGENELPEKNNYSINRGGDSYSKPTHNGITNGKDMVEVCGNSLNCNINGVRVVIIPNENGDYTLRNHESYHQSMEIKFNGGRDSQIVNKKVLTREEFNDFIKRYEDEIFNRDYSYQKAYIKESVQSFDKEREL